MVVRVAVYYIQFCSCLINIIYKYYGRSVILGPGANPRSSPIGRCVQRTGAESVWVYELCLQGIPLFSREIIAILNLSNKWGSVAYPRLLGKDRHMTVRSCRRGCLQATQACPTLRRFSHLHPCIRIQPEKVDFFFFFCTSLVADAEIHYAMNIDVWSQIKLKQDLQSE